jgi:hypothetical protein
VAVVPEQIPYFTYNSHLRAFGPQTSHLIHPDAATVLIAGCSIQMMMVVDD